jgi:3-phosphoshikimate 1-carboxyvinyltransferase
LKGLSFDLAVASAQVKSSILLAGLLAAGTTRVRQPSRSRDHTERQVSRLGGVIREEADGWVAIEGGHALSAAPTRVPGDISAAAFFMVAAAVSMRGDLTIEGLGVNPTRTGVIDVLRRMGANLAVINEREDSGEPVADVVVKGGAPLKGVRIAGDLIPRLIDEIPALAVAACCADGVTVIRDAGELRVKESDRLTAIAGELGKLGARIGVLADGLAIEGGTALTGATVESHGDHRIAMALAIAGLNAQGETVVRGAECVAISYPAFLADLRRLAGEAG